MKVKELIEVLKNSDQESLVIVDGYDDGFNEVLEISYVDIKCDVSTTGYYGQHGIAAYNTKRGKEIVKAVYLRGWNQIAKL